MKQAYLDELRALLNKYHMEPFEKEDILGDYSNMYDHWQATGMTGDEIIKKLGSPRAIISELTEGYQKTNQKPHKVISHAQRKLVALSPFLALIIFFVIGFVFSNGFAYSWTAFLLIPITAIVINMDHDRHVFVALSPFIAVISYGILGFFYDLWHPGWLVFLLIPVIAIISDAKTMKLLPFLTALSPFIAVTIFFLFFGETDAWNPGWLIFLLIPMIGALNETRTTKKLMWEVCIIGGAVLYLYIGMTVNYTWALLSFVPLVLYSFYQSDSNFMVMPKGYRILIVITTLVFVGIGLLSSVVGVNLWAVAWLVFLVVPVYAIKKEAKGSEKTIAYMPFVAVTIFFILGYFFDLWAYSWLAFLLIPMVAIIKEA